MTSSSAPKLTRMRGSPFPRPEHNAMSTVVLATARTPFGRLGGALSSLSATTLGGDAIRNAVARAGIDPAEIEHVIMGQVLQGGAGQAPARQAMFKAGLAKTTT